MKFEEFKSGAYRQQYQYKSFLPEKINLEWTWEDPRINVLLGTASRLLGELNAYTHIIPDVDLYLKMHILKEANTSSKIEGTKTSIDEDILDRESIAPEKRDDWEEVQNYVKAMNSAITELEKLPLSLRLIRNTHATLLSGVRGEHKTPGEFRTSQNWIGAATIQGAAFVPPHQDDIQDLLSDFEAFLHNEEVNVPHLIRCALCHYQFETIHPFLDGNGRIGRLLITLYLVSNKLLHKPSLYLSAYFERNRGAYYDALTRVRESNDLGQWVRFFLEGVIETTEEGKRTFDAVLALVKEHDAIIVRLGKRASKARQLINRLYASPVISVNEVSELLKIKYYSANQLVNELVKNNILNEVTGYSRNRLFILHRYVELFTLKT
jgi:Fic family protein